MVSVVLPVNPDELSSDTAEIFLNYVRNYPVLFNKQLSDYSGAQRQQALSEIANLMKENGKFYYNIQIRNI